MPKDEPKSAAGIETTSPRVSWEPLSKSQSTPSSADRYRALKIGEEAEVETSVVAVRRPATPRTDFTVVECVPYMDKEWERQYHKTITYVDTPDGIRALCEFLDSRHAYLRKAGLGAD